MKVEYYTFQLGNTTQYRGRYLDYQIILAKDNHYNKNKKWWWRVLYGKEGMGLAGEDFTGTSYTQAQNEAESVIAASILKREKEQAEIKELKIKNSREWYNNLPKEYQTFVRLVVAVDMSNEGLVDAYEFLKKLCPK